MKDYELLVVDFEKPVSIPCGMCKKLLATGTSIVMVLEKGVIKSCVSDEGKCCNELPIAIPKLFETSELAEQFTQDKFDQSSTQIVGMTLYNLRLFLGRIGTSLEILQADINDLP